MSYFAENGSIRGLTKIFDKIHVPVLFTHVQQDPETKENADLEAVEFVEFLEPAEPVESMDNVEGTVLSNNKEVANDNIEKSVTLALSIFENEKNETTVPDETNVYKHLKEYPIVNSWVQIFHWIPLPRVLRPALMKIAYSNSLAPYTITVDNFLVSNLNSLDSTIPGLRTLRMRDIRNVILDRPTKSIIATTGQSINQINDVTEKYLVTPSRNGIHQMRVLRGGYLPMIGSEPLIRSQINPIIKQVNERLAKDISRYISSRDLNLEIDKEVPINYVHLDTNDNEISHTVHLINTAVLRLRPVLFERLEQLNKLPKNSARYVSAIYEDSKANRGDGRMVVILASLETIRKLSIEGWTSVTSSEFTNFITSNPAFDEKLSIVEEAGKETGLIEAPNEPNNES